MTIRNAGIRPIALLLILVGLASLVLETKAGPVSQESHKNADTLAIFSSYRTWTKMNTEPMVISVNELAVTSI